MTPGDHEDVARRPEPGPLQSHKLCERATVPSRDGRLALLVSRTTSMPTARPRCVYNGIRRGVGRTPRPLPTTKPTMRSRETEIEAQTNARSQDRPDSVDGDPRPRLRPNSAPTLNINAFELSQHSTNSPKRSEPVRRPPPSTGATLDQTTQQCPSNRCPAMSPVVSPWRRAR